MSIFKPCDIRGLYPDELDAAAAEAIGRAVADELIARRSERSRPPNCVLAGDVRLSTPALKEGAGRGLVAGGAAVLDIGTVPTPVACWAKRRLRADGLVMVTASHNPPQYNGIKLLLGPAPLAPEDIEAIRARVEGGAGPRAAGHTEGTVERLDVRTDYMRWLADRFAFSGPGLKVLVDAGNGCASEWAPEAFRDAGYEVEELFCAPDGRFPNRSPNPTAPGALDAAAEVARRVQADLAVAFDGDADRAVFLDERGDYVPAEEILILLARDILRREPGAAVVYDQKSTRVVPQEIQRAGGRAVMERSGYAFIKRRLIEEQAALAAEASGHFFFRELAGDDGLYAALRVTELLSRSGRRLSQLRKTIPPFHITPDIRIRCREPAAVIEAVKKAFEGHPQDHTDGVRVEFEGGWALVRPSVTEPAVTVRVEGDCPERMDRLRAEVLDAVRRSLPPVDSS